MADSFSRDSLAAYEKNPQKQVPDKVMVANFMKGSTPAKAADPNAVAAVAAGNVDATPGGAPAAKSAGAAAVVDDLVVDEDGTLGDQSGTGEGTSDDLTSDSSTDTVDHGDDADTTTDLTATSDEEEVVDEPAKGSARERIVELNDKLEGAMVFGKAMQEQLKATMAENARLAAERSSTSSGATAAAPTVVSEDPGPMPDMADDEIQFDNDKYRAKMQEWSTKNARREARAIVREMTGAAQANTLMEQVNTKVDTFSKEHPEFQEVVTNNPVLKANQLAPDAGLAVARSPYTAELLMKFGNDPAFAIRIAKMHPADQLLEVGAMVAEIRAEKKAGKTTTTTTPTNKSTTATRGGAQPAARKSVSQAPPPPRATTGGGANKRIDPLDPSTRMEDFVRDHRGGKETARKENRRLRGLS